MVNNVDSVWCCILPVYCGTQPSANDDGAASKYLDEYWKKAAAVSGLVVVTLVAALYCVLSMNRTRASVKRKSSESKSGENARPAGKRPPKDSTRAKDKGGVRGIFQNGSLTRLTRLMKNVACQTIGYGKDAGHRRDSGRRPTTARGLDPAVVGSGSTSTMTEIHKAVNDFLHVSEREQLHSAGLPPVSDASDEEQPVRPPSIPVVQQSPPEDAAASPKRAHSTSH